MPTSFTVLDLYDKRPVLSINTNLVRFKHNHLSQDRNPRWTSDQAGTAMYLRRRDTDGVNTEYMKGVFTILSDVNAFTEYTIEAE